MNNVALVGRLTRDPELKSYEVDGESRSLCEFAIAVNSGRDDQEPLYIDVVAFGKQAKPCAEYLSKGRQVAVSGELRLDKWETEDGDKRSKHKVNARRVEFLGSKSQSTDDNGAEPVGVGAEDEGDPDIPF